MLSKKIRKRIGLIIIIVVFCLSVIFTIVYFNIHKNDDKTCYELSRLTYDMVEESYMNYGNIKNSKYKDIVSSHNYKMMYYIRDTDYSDPKKPYIDRSNYDILISYHSMPETTLNDSETATTTYIYETKYVADKEPTYRDGHTYYDIHDYGGGRSTCTVKWKLQSDGKWHVVDFIDPP